MKIFLAVFLLITFSCNALPWAKNDYVTSLQDGRIYDMGSGPKHLWLFSKNENGSVTIDGRCKNIYALNAKINITITATLSIPEVYQPDCFSLVFFDQSHEILESIDLCKGSTGWSTSRTMKMEELAKYKFFIFE